MAEGSVWTKVGMRPGILKVLPQTGKRVSIPRDLGRKAKAPGKRISKTGKIYWESRKSRSDMPGTNL